MPGLARFASRLARPLARWVAEDRAIALIVLVFGASQILTWGWDLPGSHGWENDGVAPRDFFGGLAHNLTPGATHRYPLFHYLLLAVPSLPVLLTAVLTGPLTGAAIQSRVLAAPTMTALSFIAKVVATLMACVSVLVLARIVRRCFGTRAGRWAALFAATNLTFAFYGRVSNLDVPYLTWSILALDALLDVLEHADGRGATRCAVLAALAVATKDQAYASFVLVIPSYLLLVPWLDRARFAPTYVRALPRAAGAGVLTYALASGALLNPRGFLRRLDELRGPSSQAWRAYSKDVSGLVANLQDAWRAAAHDFWPLPVLAFALAGIVVALVHSPGTTPLERRAARALPLVAGISSFVFFTLAVARSEHRFVLPLGFVLAAYGGVASDALLRIGERLGAARVVRALASGGIAWSALASLAVHLTQLGDARREVTRFLATKPAGTRVETYGLLVYQPHFDVSPESPYRVTRVGPEAPKSRNPLVGALELEAPIADVSARHPDVLVLSEGFANSYLVRETETARPLSGIITARQKDEATVAFVRAAAADRLSDYRIAFIARPHLPTWATALGLSPVPIQGTTGLSLWVLERRPR